MPTQEAVMTTQDVANRLHQLFNEGKWQEATAYLGRSIRYDPENQNAARVAGKLNPLALSPYVAYNRQFGSYHPAICQFVMCDGSVKGINVNIDVQNFRRLGVRNDGEAITTDF